MKTFLKFPLCLALGAMMGMSMTSCSDNDDPTDGTELSAQEKALKEVVADFADKTVIPSYQGMADAAMSLHSLCIDIRTKKHADHRRRGGCLRGLEVGARLLGEE